MTVQQLSFKIIIAWLPYNQLHGYQWRCARKFPTFSSVWSWHWWSGDRGWRGHLQWGTMHKWSHWLSRWWFLGFFFKWQRILLHKLRNRWSWMLKRLYLLCVEFATCFIARSRKLISFDQKSLNFRLNFWQIQQIFSLIEKIIRNFKNLLKTLTYCNPNFSFAVCTSCYFMSYSEFNQHVCGCLFLAIELVHCQLRWIPLRDYESHVCNIRWLIKR